MKPRRLEATKEPGWYGDGGGLWLRVFKDGSKRWIYVWTKEKKRREMGLGSFREITLAEAREQAGAARRLQKEGLDPIELRREALEEEKAEEISKEEAETPPVVPTFLEYAKIYIAAHEEGWTSEKHRWQWNNSITKHAESLLAKPVNHITADDLVDVLRPIWNVIADTAGRLRARIELILDAAKAAGHIQSPWENPARWEGNLIHRLPKRKRLATGHYPAMPYEDLPDFFVALRQRPAPAARALELTILCATRTNETLGMKWKEVNLKTGIWTVPADRMKMRIEHRIPLSQAAINVLQIMRLNREINPDNFVFPGQKKGKPLSQMSMTMVMRRMKLGHFTVHGMRSSFRDYMGDMTVHEEAVIEHALAHQYGDSTARAYRRKNAFEKRKFVMIDWAEYLLSAESQIDGQAEGAKKAA